MGQTRHVAQTKPAPRSPLRIILGRFRRSPGGSSGVPAEVPEELQPLIDTLKAALKRRFGRDVELSNEIDESVIGGAVIDAGDIVIDGSVRGRLTKMQNALAH